MSLKDWEEKLLVVRDGQRAKGLSVLLWDILGLGTEGWGSTWGTCVLCLPRNLLPDFLVVGLRNGESGVRRTVVGLRFP